MSVNNMMFSNIVAAFESAIKTETELYQSRLMKQFSNYTNILDLQYKSIYPPAFVDIDNFGESHCNNDALKKLQDDVDMLTKGLDYVMNMIISKNKIGAAEVSCSPYESDSDGEEIHVHKLPPNEIKEVYIETQITPTPTSTPLIAAEVADIIPVPIVISKAPTSIPDSTLTHVLEVTEEVVEEVAEEVAKEVAEEVAKEVVEEVAEEEEEENEEDEEEEQGVDVEEFEYKGTSYYKDPEGNVYECLESGEVGEPIGTLSKKIPGKVLFYS